MIESISGIQIRETEHDSRYRIDLGMGNDCNWGSIDFAECTKETTRQIFLLGGQYTKNDCYYISLFNWISGLSILRLTELNKNDAITVKKIMDSDLLTICDGLENIRSLEELSIRLDLLGF
jgi:hypothetical protein